MTIVRIYKDIVIDVDLAVFSTRALMEELEERGEIPLSKSSGDKLTEAIEFLELTVDRECRIGWLVFREEGSLAWSPSPEMENSSRVRARATKKEE